MTKKGFLIKCIMSEKLGCVYFLKHNNSRFIKIGMTKNPEPENRIKSFLTYAPEGGELLGYIKTDCPGQYEKQIHKMFSQFRVNGEWFDITISEVNFIINKYKQIPKVKRLLLDIPFQILDKHKNIEDLSCILHLFKTMPWEFDLKDISYAKNKNLTEIHNQYFNNYD